VGLYSAESPEEIHFSMLDAKDLSPIGYKTINKSTGREIDRSRVVKGFEYEEGQYVVVTDEDLKRANPEATQTVDIQDFVDLSDLEPVYFEKPYYLAPLKKGEKAYALLRETLKRTGKVGIARVVIRTRQYMAALYPMEKALVVNLLRYEHELRDPGELSLPSGSLKELGLTEKELQMAEKLVEGMVGSWDPKKYKDEYRDDLLTFIETKAREGGVQEGRIPEKVAESRGEVLDLMELLKKSIEQPAKGSKAKAARKPAKKPAAKRATRTKTRKSA
jgi:DNA end-binding protein Ku